MAIRFDASYNKDIRNIVGNYNQRRKRMIKAGFKERQLPANVKVSELKASYKTRSDLNRELNRLKNLGRDDVLQRIETSTGVKAAKWQLDYLKSNIKNARNYYEGEYERVSKRVLKYPGERQYADTIRANLDLLDLNVDNMSPEQFRSAFVAIKNFAKSPSKRKAEYRGFLSEVDLVMERVGISSEKRDRFFKKFEQLTPSQFLYAYDNSEIIGRVYELADSPIHGEFKLNTTDEDAENLINILLEEADDIILDAKTNMD